MVITSNVQHRAERLLTAIGNIAQILSVVLAVAQMRGC
jgi:hypothetical protein